MLVILDAKLTNITKPLETMKTILKNDMAYVNTT